MVSKKKRKKELMKVFLCHRTFKLHVEYRKNCDFQAEDSERDLSARMIDMDEHFFTPTMVQHRQEQRPRSVHSYEEVCIFYICVIMCIKYSALENNATKSIVMLCSYF